MMPKRKAEIVTETAADPKKVKKTGDRPTANYVTAQQKNFIAEFMSITQADRTTAARVLKQYNWNTQVAINAYFNNPSGAPNPARATLSKTFDKYRDNPKESPDEIGIEGTSALMGELDISLEGVGAFVFSELVQSPSLGVITREGFVDGCSEAGADTLPKLRNVVLQRQSLLPTDKDLFKRVYNHSFALGLAEKQKALPMDATMEFWKVLLQAPSFEWRSRSTPWLDWWMEFYEEKIKKAVNKDLWKQTLNFAYETMADDTLSFWSEESSYPSVIDEFVEWIKTEKRAIEGGEAMEIS